MRKVTDQEILAAFPNSTSMSNLLNKLDLCVSGIAYKIFKNRIQNLNLDLTYWNSCKNLNLKNLGKNNIIPLEKILVEGRVSSTNNLKKRLLKLNLLKNQCYECGQLPEWNGKPLTLQMDHINGIRSDNRLENLRILCPHCHSQTHTYAGKRNKKIRNCTKCTTQVFNSEVYCNECRKKTHKSKIVWPSVVELQKMLAVQSFVEVGKKLGVTDNSVRKHLEKHGIFIKKNNLTTSFNCDYCFKFNTISLAKYRVNIKRNKNQKVFCGNSCGSYYNEALKRLER